MQKFGLLRTLFIAEEFSSHVDEWIGFSIDKEVEELHLCLSIVSDPVMYTLPQKIFSA